ncbi:MAG: hypothetical protein MN733_31095 [Nitrososphaera sp.]|nr:hypothetical protein [Nitrososphaera sp.]
MNGQEQDNDVRFFWYDHEAEPERNEPKLKDLGFIVKSFGAIRRKWLLSEAQQNCVVFVHAGNREGFRQGDWGKCADPQKKKFVVFVSSVPGSLHSERLGTFTLRLELSIVKALFELYPNRVQRFRESCENGDPDWRVFNVEYPEYLVSAYLILLAEATLATEIKLDDGFWSEANEAYNKLAVGYRLEIVSDDRIQLGHVRAVLDKISAVLSRAGASG